MAFTRKMLKAMGIEDDKIDEIIDAHREVTDALKGERDKYKADADKLAETEKELKDLKNEVDGKDSYKEKYEKEHREFADFKKQVSEKELRAAKETAYKDVLKDAGLSDKGIAKAMKYADWSAVELDDENRVKDAKDHIKSVKEEWSDYLVKESSRGANTENPPTNTGGSKMTKAEIYKKDDHGRYVLSTQERQKAIAESLKE